MAIQTINLGTQPSGTGGDTNRSANVKVNENFSNPLHAASRMVGAANGELAEYSNTRGLSGFGYGGAQGGSGTIAAGMVDTINGFYGQGGTSADVPKWNSSGDSSIVSSFNGTPGSSTIYSAKLHFAHGKNTVSFRHIHNGTNKGWQEIYHTANTTKDANGFLKAASPVVQLYADKIDPNAEAAEQNPVFEKVSTGHYLVKGTQGFAVEGWWIEVPADTNGNKICAVQYQTLENGDLEIKTFKKKLNEDGDIVPNLDTPIDIPNNANGEPRWIDIRLNPLPPKPIVEQVPRTEKQPKMVKQIKYSMQPTFMTKLTDLIDDKGQLVMVNGKAFQKQETYMVTDSQGMVTLTNQPVINEQGENVFEFVQMIDANGQPVFEDVPVLDADGNQIFDEVIHESQQ